MATKKTMIHRASNAPTVSQSISFAQAAYKNERKIKVEKNQKWASSPKEQAQVLEKAFKDYLESLNFYDDQDIKDLMEIYKMQIDSDNINLFIHRPCKEIYIGLIYDKLDEIKNKTDKIII